MAEPSERARAFAAQDVQQMIARVFPRKTNASPVDSHT